VGFPHLFKGTPRAVPDTLDRATTAHLTKSVASWSRLRAPACAPPSLVGGSSIARARRSRTSAHSPHRSNWFRCSRVQGTLGHGKARCRRRGLLRNQVDSGRRRCAHGRAQHPPTAPEGELSTTHRRGKFGVDRRYALERARHQPSWVRLPPEGEINPSHQSELDPKPTQLLTVAASRPC
jgi:hypothetical protein